MAFEKGETAPDFKLEDQTGKVHTLADYKGKNLVIYFYPKDNTPGCTKESCSFRDNIAAFADKNVVVLGVSKDSAASHQKFIDKFELPFPLLVDEDLEMMTAYDCWKEKNMYGKKVMGCVRSTVLIDTEGKVIKHWPKVTKAEFHPEKVLEVINEEL